jgi:hypothetical protein
MAIRRPWYFSFPRSRGSHISWLSLQKSSENDIAQWKIWPGFQVLWDVTMYHSAGHLLCKLLLLMAAAAPATAAAASPLPAAACILDSYRTIFFSLVALCFKF